MSQFHNLKCNKSYDSVIIFSTSNLDLVLKTCPYQVSMHGL